MKWEAVWLHDGSEVKRDGGSQQGLIESPCAFVALQAEDLPAPLSGNDLPDGTYTLILSIDCEDVQRASATVGLSQENEPAGAAQTRASTTGETGTATEQAVDEPREVFALYQSELFDYFFFYDPRVWEIAGEQSSGKAEWVRFVDDDVVADYVAAEMPGVTAKECVQQRLIDLENDPSIVEIEGLSAEGVIHDVWENLDKSSAHTTLVLTVESGNDRFKLAASEECTEIVPGESLLDVSIFVPAETFNEGRELTGPEVFMHLPSLERQILIPEKSGRVVAGFDPYLIVCEQTSSFDNELYLAA